MLLEDYGIRPLKIGYDRYSAQYLITDMANYGFHMDDVYQGENLTPVIREFEGIIKDGDFKIADNNLLKTHFLNVALKHNMETRKFRPIKIEQRAHIDGFVSVIDAKTGETTGKGVFTIVEVKAGQGASAGWGRLKSGAGWISLDYATRLA